MIKCFLKLFVALNFFGFSDVKEEFSAQNIQKLTCRWDLVTDGAHFIASFRISPQRAAKSFTMFYKGTRTVR